jgi:cell division septum initiation protein DivIVA
MSTKPDPGNTGSTTSAESAMNTVLEAEENARRAVENCAHETDTILQQARLTAQGIVERADRRITRIHQHCNRAVAATVSELERDQQEKVSKFDATALDTDAVAAVVEQVAELLTT